MGFFKFDTQEVSKKAALMSSDFEWNKRKENFGWVVIIAARLTAVSLALKYVWVNPIIGVTGLFLKDSVQQPTKVAEAYVME